MLPVELRWGSEGCQRRISAVEWGDRASREARWAPGWRSFPQDPFVRQAGLCMLTWHRNVRICRRQGQALRAWRETWPCPGGRSTATNLASRGRRRTGKPVTESNLSLRAPAQRAADLVGEATFGRTSSEATERGDLRVVGTVGRRPILPMCGSCTPVYLCIRLHVANVGGARQFSLMWFVSGAPNADSERLAAGTA
jgi:hypothetical protein